MMAAKTHSSTGSDAGDWAWGTLLEGFNLRSRTGSDKPSQTKREAPDRDAAGHSNISITSAYLHIVVEDGDQVGELFG